MYDLTIDQINQYEKKLKSKVYKVKIIKNIFGNIFKILSSK